MKGIWYSTTRFVFIIMILSLVVFTGMGIIPPKDFMIIAGMASGYFFHKQGTDAKGDPHMPK